MSDEVEYTDLDRFADAVRTVCSADKDYDDTNDEPNGFYVDSRFNSEEHAVELTLSYDNGIVKVYLVKITELI